MSNTETGFGSPSILPAPTYYDWGFGSPTPLDLDTGEEDIRGRDTAFGSPYAATAAAAFLSGEYDLIPDDGGVLLEINSDWSTAGFNQFRGQLGPFEVTYINAATSARTLATGLTGRGLCFTNFRQDKLLCGVPPLPHGEYSVEVSWFGGTRQLVIDGAFSVGLRPRSEQAYGIRRHLPAFMQRGPVYARAEAIEPWERSSNLEAVTKAIGDLFQVLAGRPQTCLTSEVQADADTLYVETTIGFAQAGSLSIDGVTFYYSGKTTNSFTGVTSQILYDYIENKTEVFQC